MYIQWFQKSSADKNKRKEKKEDRLIFYAWDIKNQPIKDILQCTHLFLEHFLQHNTEIGS